MSKHHSLFGFLGSLFIHGLLAFVIVMLIMNKPESANGYSADLVDTNISMEMLQAMVRVEPEPEPEPEIKQEEPKEEVADPTVKPEPEKIEKPKEPEKKQPKEKPKPKPKPKKKTPPKDVIKGDRDIDSKDKVNSQATSTGIATTNNPNLAGSGASASELDAYRSALRREIERHKRYPQRARMMRKQGVVMVSFSIAADGTLTNVNVVKSSGASDLDEAALTAVKSARSIGPRPAGLGTSISVPISFKLR
ncbi:outer membrane transport energization protein TonB [Bisgaardia hudsonensis]|uniref:Protein TonB n=1 Tax=Bisgaardia hudsonensis TaxID=109472 RepID=A0A4R2N0L3_9PAST|nr:energy transducer TonB [Bisgaardia hudsonensis]QLB13499.1 energy transducer TonB [Bisgaardia hudsonensis]TCP12910.1 outer membrane transport energization protein TonB [Bisgaardia hudsonensis]